MLKFILRHMRTRLSHLVLIALSLIITAAVALLAYNISTQVSEGIVQTASHYDLILGPAGSSTQLAMNTLFFTDKPLGTIPYSVVEELRSSNLTNEVIPFSMGDSYNSAPIVGTEPALLEGKTLAQGEMFSAPLTAVVGSDVARMYSLAPGDQIITSHGLSGTGASHSAAPLTVTGVLAPTGTRFDRVVFTPCESIWALHDHGDDEDEEEEDEAHEAHEEGEICAVLVRSKSIAAYSQLMSAYSSKTEYLIINPNTVLREVLDNVDLSRRIVYILCGVILVMNLFVVTMIALMSAYDAKDEIALMRLIGISMGKIRRMYLLENALAALCAMLLSLLGAHALLSGMRSYVAGMGIVLAAWRVYPMEWLILLAVFVLSLLPTYLMTWRMARQDGLPSGAGN